MIPWKSCIFERVLSCSWDRLHVGRTLHTKSVQFWNIIMIGLILGHWLASKLFHITCKTGESVLDIIIPMQLVGLWLGVSNSYKSGYSRATAMNSLINHFNEWGSYWGLETQHQQGLLGSVQSRISQLQQEKWYSLQSHKQKQDKQIKAKVKVITA